MLVGMGGGRSAAGLSARVLGIVALVVVTGSCGGSGSGGTASGRTSSASTSATPSASATAGKLPAGFPARPMSYDLKKAFVAPDGETVFPGHYALTVSPDGSAVLSMADGHDIQVVVHDAGTGRVQVLQDDGAQTLGNFHWVLAGSTLTFSDDRPGLETTYDRYLLASPFTVGKA